MLMLGKRKGGSLIEGRDFGALEEEGAEEQMAGALQPHHGVDTCTPRSWAWGSSDECLAGTP